MDFVWMGARGRGASLTSARNPTTLWGRFGRILVPMQILTTGKNLDIGDALRRRIEQRLTSNLAKYFDGTVRAHVVVELQKSRFHTDCTLHLSTGLTLQSHGEDSAANGSFDMAAERLEKQLRRYKRRLRDHHPGGPEDPGEMLDALPEDLEELEPDEIGWTDPGRIEE